MYNSFLKEMFEHLSPMRLRVILSSILHRKGKTRQQRVEFLRRKILLRTGKGCYWWSLFRDQIRGMLGG